MAINFKWFNFFNRLDARSRVFFLFGAVIGVILIVYFLTRYFFGGEATVGPSAVATAPAGLVSVQGGRLSAEYQQSLEQANLQAAQQAQLTGGGAIPTQINIGTAIGTGACIVCTDEATNIKNSLNGWQSQGLVTPDTVTELQQLADRNVSPEEFATTLDRMVKEGRLTPEQARQLLDQYRKQHANALVNESAKVMDGMIKSGNLPTEVANRLLNAQKNNVSPADYSALLQDQVAQGKLSNGAAQQLLAQYTQQKARVVTARSIASLKQMAAGGQLTPDVLTQLVDLETRMVPLDSYSTTLQQLLSQGKLVPATAAKILDEYRAQKAEIGPTASISQMVANAEKAAFDEINQLLSDKKIAPETAALLTKMIQDNVSQDSFNTAVAQLVQQNKLPPDIAKLKVADYTAVKGLRDMAGTLSNLQANNASPNAYANALRDAVRNGVLTPEQAAQLAQEYQAMLDRSLVPTAAPTIAGTDDFARLQQRVQAAGVAPTTGVTPTDFARVQTQVTQVGEQDRQAQIEALRAAMAGQAQQLITAWEPPVMQHQSGTFESDLASSQTSAGQLSGRGASTTTQTTMGAPLIKAGTILFAVLDTTVNSDFPDNPVMATIVSGKFKGAKLLGKLVLTKGVAGQQDRVTLNFTLMNMDEWDRSRAITAYAIDPDTGKAALATDVNYHYLQRYGLIFATSFLQGYAGAITNAGTSTTGIFGTSTTHPELDAKSKLLVGLGQVGQTLGQATQNYINIPPTVKVDSGVGLGILFMSDVA